MYTRKVGERVERESATQKLKYYISINQISINEIVENTGVSKRKLTDTSNAVFNATEFLEICCFLKVDPRIFA